MRSLVGSFCAILLVTSLSFSVTPSALPFLLGSNGASAVLIYALPTLKPSQPRAVIGGNLVSAFVGVSVRKLVVEIPQCDSCLGVASALAVALAILAMQLTGTVHPPGGATALLAVVGGMEKLGYMYLIFPVLVSSLVLLVVGILSNNLFGLEGYPQSWF